MNLFIDTNVLLSFYHFTSDDLEELRKLVILVREGQLGLFLPEQTVAEFRRNRASKIADAIKQLREQRLKWQYPQIARDYGEYGRLRELQREVENCQKLLIEQIERDVAERRLKADEIIEELFKYAHHIPTTEDIVSIARLRMDLGNPPGKKGSLGDAVNWESLLQAVPEREDIHFITDDRDFTSPLDFVSFEPFLLGEWEEKKRSNLILYTRLSDFFRQHFPDIKIASEFEKELLIRDLANSPNFATTHLVIARLSRYSDFTSSQLNGIVAAAITNTQIYWIIDDQDVKDFITSVLVGREDQVDPDNLRRLQDLINKPEDDEETSWTSF